MRTSPDSCGAVSPAGEGDGGVRRCWAVKFWIGHGTSARTRNEGRGNLGTHRPSGNMVQAPGCALLQVEAGAVDLDFEEGDFADTEADEGERRRGRGEGQRDRELDRGLRINPEDGLGLRMGVHEERVRPPPKPG